MPQVDDLRRASYYCLTAAVEKRDPEQLQRFLDLADTMVELAGKRRPAEGSSRDG